MDRSLRELRGRLEVLERTRREAFERNENAQKTNVAMTHEYAANLKVSIIFEMLLHALVIL